MLRSQLSFIALSASVILLQISGSQESTVAGDPLCSSSFHLLEADLLSRPQNRFHLTTKFFPPRDANPVIIKVDYVYEDSNTTNVWFWSESEFYFIQPLEIFLYTSLFFANQPYRQSTVTLELSADCLNAEDLHMKVLTQRLKLYAQSATTSPAAGTKSVSDNYIAVAASLAEIQSDDLISDFTKVWLHLILVLFPLLTWLMLYLCDPVNLLLGDKTWQKLDDENSHPVIAALIQVSALFTFFVFILDWVALAQTIKGDFLAYDRNAAFYLSAATGLLIDFGAFGWVVYVLLSSCQWDCKNYWKDKHHQVKQECPERIKKLMYTIMVAPILCLSSHLYYIILAFISDPTHAGLITYGHVITFFLFYFVFRQFYGRVVLRSNRRQEPWEKEKIAVNVATSQIDFSYRLAQIAKERGDKEAYRRTFTENGMQEPKPRKIKPRRRILRVPFDTRVVVRGLLLIGPVMVLYEFMFIVLFLSLPISKALEAVPNSLFSLYGTGFAIVVLLTYSIVLNPSPFSLSKAAEKIGKDLCLPRRYVNWHKFTDEEKFATLVTYLLRHREDLAPSPEPEFSSGVDTSEGDSSVRLLEEQEQMREEAEDLLDSKKRGNGGQAVTSVANLLPLTTQEITIETKI